MPFVCRKELGVAKEKSDVLQGTLGMLVLRALQLEPMHGGHHRTHRAMVRKRVAARSAQRCIPRCTASNAKASSGRSGV